MELAYTPLGEPIMNGNYLTIKPIEPEGVVWNYSGTFGTYVEIATLEFQSRDTLKEFMKELSEQTLFATFLKEDSFTLEVREPEITGFDSRFLLAIKHFPSSSTIRDMEMLTRVILERIKWISRKV